MPTPATNTKSALRTANRSLRQMKQAQTLRDVNAQQQNQGNLVNSAILGDDKSNRLRKDLDNVMKTCQKTLELLIEELKQDIVGTSESKRQMAALAERQEQDRLEMHDEVF